MKRVDVDSVCLGETNLLIVWLVNPHLMRKLPSLTGTQLGLTDVPVDKFGFAYLNLCSLKHDPKTMQLGLLTREIFTVSKVNLRVKEVA